MLELPPFKRGDLFCLGFDRVARDEPIACIGLNGGPYDFGDYALGYFEAAERLLRSIQEDRWGLNLMIYPLCFLYRQGIELGIKHLLMYTAPLFGEECTPEMSHSLTQNWGQLRAYLVRQRCQYTDEPLISETTLCWMDDVIADFVSTDLKSFVFRYPVDKNHKPYLQDKEHVNITQFAKFMGPLSQWFHDMILVTARVL